MNTRPPWESDSPMDTDAREWELQERARSDVRDAIAADAVPGDFAAYRRIAQALRTPPPERLPSNFAFQVAQIAARAPDLRRFDRRLEQWLVRGLLAALVVGTLVVGMVYGGSWLRALDATGTGVTGWLGTAVACVALTWGMQGWRALLQRRR